MKGRGSGSHLFCTFCFSFPADDGGAVGEGSKTTLDTSTVLRKKVGNGLILERITSI
jgi:hypothetical protein